MSNQEPEIKRWTAKRKVKVVVDILKGKATVAEVARQYDLKPGEVQAWVEEDLANMENSFRARPKDVKAQYKSKLAEAYAALGEAQLQIKTLKKLQCLLDSQGEE